MRRTRKIPFVLYLILFHATWTAWVYLGYPQLRTLGEKTFLYSLVNVSIRLLLWVLPVFAYLRFVDGVDPLEYLKLRRHWLRGLVIALTFTALNLLLLLEQRGLPQTGPRLTWNNLLSTTLLIGFVEEVPYRGFIFQKLDEWLSFPLATFLSSLLFLAIHLPGWISLHMFKVHNAIFVFVFGAIMAVLLRFARSLWAPVVSHSLNDFLATVIFHI